MRRAAAPGDDQFDAKASRSATAVVSNTPIFGMDTLANTQNAIGQYQQIVSAGGWPQVNSPVRLEMGVSDPSVQALRQRLIISGDLPRSAGISNSFDSYVDGAVKRFQGPSRPAVRRRARRIFGEGAEYRCRCAARPVKHQYRAPAVDVG